MENEKTIAVKPELLREGAEQLRHLASSIGEHTPSIEAGIVSEGEIKEAYANLCGTLCQHIERTSTMLQAVARYLEYIANEFERQDATTASDISGKG